MGIMETYTIYIHAHVLLKLWIAVGLLDDYELVAESFTFLSAQLFPTSLSIRVAKTLARG